MGRTGKILRSTLKRDAVGPSPEGSAPRSGGPAQSGVSPRINEPLTSPTTSRPRPVPGSDSWVTKKIAEPFTTSILTAPWEIELHELATVYVRRFVPFGAVSTMYHMDVEVGGSPAQRLVEVAFAAAPGSPM